MPARFHVVAEKLSREGWAPFGWLPVADTDPLDGTNRLAFEWNDPHLNVICHQPGEVTRSGACFRCDRMYRHVTHTQALMVLDRPSVIAVAPPGVEFETPDDAAHVRAFVLGQLDSVVLHRGTWHWGPFPLGGEPVHLYNVQAYGYRDDNESIDLTGLGAGIEVECCS